MALYKSTELTNKTVSVITKFQSGEITPISTGIPHLDKVLKGGLLPGTIVGIVARSQHGKSYDLERIQRHLLTNNKDIAILSGNYELSFFKILVRDICQRTGKSMEEVLFNSPLVEDLKKMKDICDSHRNEDVYYQNEPVSPDTFFDDVKSLIDKYPEKKIVVTVDNLENILDTKGSQKSSQDAFLTKINILKDMHPFICFIILNQMNDNYVMRKDDIKKQRPIESDVYGSGQLMKLCDVLYIKMLPWRLNIQDRFMVFNEDSYQWLDEFKVNKTSGSVASFDPVGVGYYFYLKRRNADIKDVQDVFAERIFKRGETNFKIDTPNANVTIAPPIFNNSDTSAVFSNKALSGWGNKSESPF